MRPDGVAVVAAEGQLSPGIVQSVEGHWSVRCDELPRSKTLGKVQKVRREVTVCGRLDVLVSLTADGDLAPRCVAGRRHIKLPAFLHEVDRALLRHLPTGSIRIDAADMGDAVPRAVAVSRPDAFDLRLDGYRHSPAAAVAT